MSKRSAVAALAITPLLLSACAAVPATGEGPRADQPGSAVSDAPAAGPMSTREPAAKPTREPAAKPTREPTSVPVLEEPEHAVRAGDPVLEAPVFEEWVPEESALPGIAPGEPAPLDPAHEEPVFAAPEYVEDSVSLEEPVTAGQAALPTEAPVRPGPTPGPKVSDAPVKGVEPPPTDPGQPFVPPPHGEPNPLPGNPSPEVPPPGPPHTVPGPPSEENVSVAYPQPGYPGPLIAVSPGVLRIGGHGYSAGEMISVLFSVPNSDDNFLDHGQGGNATPSVVYADNNGSYTFDIQLSPALAPGEYAVMTWAPNRGGDAAEASKRFLGILLG